MSAAAAPEAGAGADQDVQDVPPAEALLDMFEQMVVIRATEKAAYDLFMSGLVKGTTHLAAGQEAVAVGASAALRPDDYVFATYRGHHHAIARGAAPEACLAELMSRATGLCAAKGGSMHLTVASGNMLGSYAIVGAHLPIACGAAWSAKLRGSGQVAVAFFGDGATNIGAFHEALNLAAVWRLPVLFVCENNLLVVQYSRTCACWPQVGALLPQSWSRPMPRRVDRATDLSDQERPSLAAEACANVAQ